MLGSERNEAVDWLRTVINIERLHVARFVMGDGYYSSRDDVIEVHTINGIVELDLEQTVSFLGDFDP